MAQLREGGGTASEAHADLTQKERPMDLTVWLPAMFILGLATFALMAAFVPFRDKV